MTIVVLVRIFDGESVKRNGGGDEPLTLNLQQFARSARPKQDNTDTKKGPKQR